MKVRSWVGGILEELAVVLSPFVADDNDDDVEGDVKAPVSGSRA